MAAGPPERLLGTVVDGRYTLKRLLGRGGFGLVFQAEDLYGAPCAVKLIRCDTAAERGDALLEAALMRDHPHPGLVACHDVGRFGPTVGGFVFVAMELGEGSLYQRVHGDKPLAPAELRALVLDLLEALTHLHERGIVHLDVKPGNVIGFGGRYKLGDFGSARALGSRVQRSLRRSGTPEYMAPEAFDLQEGPPADLWGVGMLVHECATGELPFAVKGKDPEEIGRIVRETAPRVDPRLPAPFGAIVRGCLARDPARRWTAAEVREALLRAPLAVAARPRGLAAPRVLGAAIAVALAVLALACGIGPHL